MVRLLGFRVLAIKSCKDISKKCLVTSNKSAPNSMCWSDKSLGRQTYAPANQQMKASQTRGRTVTDSFEERNFRISRIQSLESRRNQNWNEVRGNYSSPTSSTQPRQNQYARGVMTKRRFIGLQIPGLLTLIQVSVSLSQYSLPFFNTVDVHVQAGKTPDYHKKFRCTDFYQAW